MCQWQWRANQSNPTLARLGTCHDRYIKTSGDSISTSVDIPCFGRPAKHCSPWRSRAWYICSFQRISQCAIRSWPRHISTLFYTCSWVYSTWLTCSLHDAFVNAATWCMASCKNLPILVACSYQNPAIPLHQSLRKVLKTSYDVQEWDQSKQKVSTRSFSFQWEPFYFLVFREQNFQLTLATHSLAENQCNLFKTTGISTPL